MREREANDEGLKPRYRATDCSEPGKLSNGIITQLDEGCLVAHRPDGNRPKIRETPRLMPHSRGSHC